MPASSPTVSITLRSASDSMYGPAMRCKRFPERSAARQAVSRMERELSRLQEAISSIQDSYGHDHLHLTVVKRYLRKLITNDRVARYLAQYQPELFNRISEDSRNDVYASERGGVGLKGTRTQKRGDRRRSRTLGRIDRGDGDGGEPVWSPLGRSSFRRPNISR